MMRANGFTRKRAKRRAACAIAYGGSEKATSYCPRCSCSANLRASTRWTTVRSSTSRSVMLALSADNASRWTATRAARTALFRSASRPSAPEPANRSSTRAPRSGRCRMENQASRTRPPLGRTAAPAGGFKRRPLNSPAMMRIIPPLPPPRVRNAECGMRNVEASLSRRATFQFNSALRIPHSALSSTRRHRCHPCLECRASLPLVALQAERDVQPLREPVIGDRVGPLEGDRGEDARRVVQGKTEVIRPDAPRTDGAGLPHAEDRRRITRTARLQVADQLLQLVAHEAQRQLQVDPLGGHQVVGAQKLARDGEKCNTERVVALAADGEPRRHGMAAVLLEMAPDAMQRGVQIEARDAPPRATPQLAPLFPADEERGPPIALDQAGRDDPDHPRMPRIGGEHQRPVLRPQHALGQLHRLVEDALVQRLAPGVQRLELAGDRRRLARIVGEEQPQSVVRIPDPPRRIQTRRQDQPDVARLDRLPREARRSDQPPPARPLRLRE